MKQVFWNSLLLARESQPHSLYKFMIDVDLVRPVTVRAASFWNFSSAFLS